MKRSPRRERGSNIEPIELLLDRPPRPTPVERRCCCTPRSLANAVRCFHCLARRGLQQFRRTRSAPPTPRDEEGGVISPLILASPPRRKRRSPSETRTVSTCATPANTPYGGARAPAGGAFPSPPRPRSRSPPAAAKTGAKISPSVQPGSVAARLKAMQAAKPPPPPPRPPSAAAERLRARRAAPACGRCGLDVHVADRVVHRDTAYHAQCLRCGACRRSVVDLAWGTLDGDDVILCDDRGVTAGRRSCLVKARTQSLEHAKADQDERPSEADVAGIREAKLRVVELVGDELEQLALTGIAPTCALCGGRFAPSDRIVMQGMVKMHEACMTGSKPAQCSGPRLPPARALKDAPATLVIKLALAPTKVATFYVARVEQEDETCVAYGPDPAARAPPKRRVDVAALAGATVRALSLQGAEVAPATTLDGEIAPFRWTAQGLKWRFDVRFDADAAKNVVAVDGATLTVTIN